jgi:hypothetical protein
VKQFWLILSGVFALVALIFFTRQDYDKAFICAALGAVAWFLRYRTQMKERVRANEPEETSESLNANEEE